ncbi:glycosyltransferase [Brevundimonas sp. P7753]|uniref:glycosyltransferase n=1 Tax=Brevundimonas sp. P7753 TaxID=2726982 RepID=UPI0015B936E7|nr:glycosyltransferase [Brevundimonas sp. P7753]NWE51243.1 glycosyltransferase [Brevundimonas sp. P7753]
MNILSLGTYPIATPIHGGQRRVSNLGRYYKANNTSFRYASVYMPGTYGGSAVTADDIPYASPGGMFSDIPFIDDLGSGVFAAQNEAPLNHFRKIVEDFEPDVIQLDQPFMWPLVDKLQQLGDLSSVTLVYSSHNHEAPLKRSILEAAGVTSDKVKRATSLIEAVERDAVDAADLIVAVSQTEADYYRALGCGAPVLTIRNGTDRPGRSRRPYEGGELPPGEYLVFVGSAYPPNVTGFTNFVLSESLYGLPPTKQLAVCGGAADGIFGSQEYLPHASSYGDRVHFFSRPSDPELHWIQERSKGTILPISSGGGSNLKTAEALCGGKWVIATPVALRSFEDFEKEKGVLVARTPKQFRDAMLDVLHGPQLELTKKQLEKRHTLYWDNLLERSGLIAAIKKAASPMTGKVKA